MKKLETTLPALRSSALIAVARPSPRRGVFATCARAAFAILALPVRLPILAVVALARGVAWTVAGTGRAVAAVAKGLGRGVGLLSTGLVRLVAAPFVLGARLLGGIARLLGAAVGGTARGAVRLGSGAGKGIVALLLLPVRLAVLLARGVAFLLRVPLLALRLLGRGGLCAARGLGWLGARAGRGSLVTLMLPVRALALLARLVVVLGRLLGRGLVLALRLPFVLLRLLGRGSFRAVRGIASLGAAITVPAAALAWGVVRSLAAGIFATVRGIAKALAFLGRLLARGVAAVGRGALATVVSIATGIFACVRGTLRLALKIVLLPFLAARIVAVAVARHVRNGVVLLADALRTVVAALAEVMRAVVALVRFAGRGITKPALAALTTREPQNAAFLPLATLAVLGGAEIVGRGGFPFATVGILVIAAFAALALLSRPVSMPAVLLAWGLAVIVGWRAAGVSLDTPAWLDALVYLSALAALRSAYVAVRTFVRESPSVPRGADQVVAHRRASRAIGLVLVAQCIGFAFWSAAKGSLSSAPVFGELLLVGAGIALTWVVRTGLYVRTAQVALTLGTVGALVLAIATQFSAFGAGQLFSAASLGAGLLLLLVASALTIVIHTRIIDTEHGA